MSKRVETVKEKTGRFDTQKHKKLFLSFHLHIELDRNLQMCAHKNVVVNGHVYGQKRPNPITSENRRGRTTANTVGERQKEP